MTHCDDRRGQLQHLLQCPVCLDSMKEQQPRFLDCHHSCCTPCLQQLVQPGRHGETIYCPECRALTMVPIGGVAELPLDFKSIQWYDTLSSVIEADSCFFCAKLGRRVGASHFCKDCRRHLCQLCTGKHMTVPLFRGHVLEAVSEEFSDVAYCHDHGEKFRYLCKACQPIKGLCDICMMYHDQEIHGDSISSYEVTIPVLKAELLHQCDRLQRKSKYLSKVSSLYDKAEEEIQELVEARKEAVQAEGAGLVQKLDERRNREQIAAQRLNVESDITLGLDVLKEETEPDFPAELKRITEYLSNTHLTDETLPVPLVTSHCGTTKVADVRWEACLKEGQTSPEGDCLPSVKSDTPDRRIHWPLAK